MRPFTLSVLVWSVVARSTSASAQNPGAGGLTGLTCYRVAVALAKGAEAQIDSAAVQTAIELGLRRSGIKVLPADTSTAKLPQTCAEVRASILVSVVPESQARSALRMFYGGLEVNRWASLPGESRARWLSVWTAGGMNWTRSADLWENMRPLISELTDRLANDFLSVRSGAARTP